MGQEQLLYCAEGSLEMSHINLGEFIWTNQDAQSNIFFVLISSHLGNLKLYHSDFCVVKWDHQKCPKFGEFF